MGQTIADFIDKYGIGLYIPRVHITDIIEVLIRFKSGSRHVASGNIQQNINLSPLGNNLFRYFFQTGDVQHVSNNTDNILTILFKFFYTVVQLFLTDVDSYNFCSLLYKVLGDISSQHTTCSGNYSYLTGNTK